MKPKIYFFLFVLLSAVVISCSEDDEPRKGDTTDIAHAGEKWNIATVDYYLVDQNTSGTVSQTIKTDSKTNAGSFYFIEAENKGSFEMNIEGYNKEDVFSYTLENGDLSILTIEQSVGVTTNQNVIAMSGSATAAEMTVSGTIIKQSTSGQFLLEVEMLLQKEQ